MPKYLRFERRSERPPSGQRHLRTTTSSSADAEESKVMDPQGITEARQDRTGSWVHRHAEYTPQEPAGGRS
jgi:hypothetical protein